MQTASETQSQRAADADFLDPRHLIKLGGIVVSALVAIFFVWAAIAPLASAITSPGVVVVKSYRKSIQHLEGGIVREVLVQDGDRVAQGQSLLRLDDAQARASLNLLQGELDALGAQEARLTAERDGKTKIEFPPELLARIPDPKVAEAVHGEEGAFNNRRETLSRQGSVTSISADRLTDQRTGQAYFIARIAIETDAWKDFPEVRFTPGMPVEVAVETGTQTALEYFFAPIQAVMRRGMREK